jgi:hypothetical protein
MKIKRFNNLWLMGLILSASILGVIYLLKICFPQFVIEVAQIDSITRIGHYIDTHKWAWYILSIIISFISYYFICCASCRKRTLNYKEILCIFVAIGIVYFSKEFLPNQYLIINLCSMLILPLLFKGDFLATIVCFSFVNILQTLTLEIRNLNLMVSDYNFATGIILLIDIYILQVLLYLFFNYKKE